jgi:hypothetical protein
MVSMASAEAALNALTALLNTGGAGSIKIFTGSAPATCETADSGTLLATLALSATAFGNATDPGSTGLATATANSITSATAAATGTAGYFRAYNGSGTCIVQGTVGTASADMILNTTSIVSGATVAITSWVITLPDGSGAD